MQEAKFTAFLAKSGALSVGEDGISKLKLEAPASQIQEVLRLVEEGRKIQLDVSISPAQPTLDPE